MVRKKENNEKKISASYTGMNIGNLTIGIASDETTKKAKEPYSALLKKPQWQRRRLEIFNRDEWKCQCCGDTENELHVHHKQYRDGLSPWEYEDIELITLCTDCHGVFHAVSKEFKMGGDYMFSVYCPINDGDYATYFVVFNRNLFYVKKTCHTDSTGKEIAKYDVDHCLDTPFFASFSEYVKANDTWH